MNISEDERAEHLLDLPIDQPPAPPQPMFAVSVATGYGKRTVHTQDCTRMGLVELMAVDQIPPDTEACKICEPEVAP